jgi:hypothetical protein
MVQTWEFQKGPDEICDNCGAVYSVTITRLPVRDSDSFNCEICGQLVKKWNSTTSYNYELKNEIKKVDFEGTGIRKGSHLKNKY